jgi:triacylglycerol lipase
MASDATVPRSTPSGGRLHIVLIPGFGGFDALGQLEYYAGVTPLFRQWQRRRQEQAHAVLHYFDNFPTAAVRTRARRLQSYLAKRIARGEFQPGDVLALVGHSTGGLDIRWLLWELGYDPDRTIPVDGGQGSAFTVRAKEILNLVHRVVFLSVPQWGTNIADWVHAHTITRTTVVAELRAVVGGSQFPFLDRIEGWLAQEASNLTGLDLMRAVQDALSEADARTREQDPTSTADAHEAASQLELWLRYIASDFSAINDLSSVPPRGDLASPAHFSSERRDDEIGLWASKQIRTRSYATLGLRPFRFEAGGTAPPWILWEPWTYPELTTGSGSGAETDITYRTCYRACAGGPFDHRSAVPMPKGLGRSEQHRIELLTNGQGIELWDNDGIVNTASMLWPDGENTALVAADHLDIVGHYQLVEAIPGGGRRYHAYDLLKSASGFTDDSFELVWSDVFDFCRTS